MIAAPTLASGLSFSRDGRTLYFVALDLDPTYQASRLCRYDVATGELSIVAHDLRGPGGSLSPDGRRYLFAHADGDHHDLAEVDVATGVMRVIAHETHGAYIANPRFSPDGTRVVATRFDGLRFRIVVLDPADGRLLSTLATGDDLVSDPSWVDDRRVIYLGGAPSDAGFQVYGYELATGPDRQADAGPLPRVPARRHRRADAAVPEPRGLGVDARRDPAARRCRAAPPPAPAAPALAAAAPAQNLPPPPVASSSHHRHRRPAAASSIHSIDHLFVPHLYGPTFAVGGPPRCWAPCSPAAIGCRNIAGRWPATTSSSTAATPAARLPIRTGNWRR